MQVPGLVTRDVLVMDYLPEVETLKDAFRRHHDNLATTLGYASGDALKQAMQEAIIGSKIGKSNPGDEEEGGVASSHDGTDGASADTDQNGENHRPSKENGEPRVAMEGEEKTDGGGGGGPESAAKARVAALALQLLTKPQNAGSVMQVLRGYEVVNRKLVNLGVVLYNAPLRLPLLRPNYEPASLRSPPLALSPPAGPDGGDSKRKGPALGLVELVELIAAVHGLQLFTTGNFNTDPHPGNILLLQDGRVGLIDYGQVGLLTLQHRIDIARLVIGICAGDFDFVVEAYKRIGYRTKFMGAGCIHRAAILHLDRLDLSDIDGKNITEAFKEDEEIFVPDAIMPVRRCTTLLMGISLQAAVPLSVSKVWYVEHDFPCALRHTRTH